VCLSFVVALQNIDAASTEKDKPVMKKKMKLKRIQPAIGPLPNGPVFGA
jgi:hypothetical protein